MWPAKVTLASLAKKRLLSLIGTSYNRPLKLSGKKDWQNSGSIILECFTQRKEVRSHKFASSCEIIDVLKQLEKKKSKNKQQQQQKESEKP